MNRTMVNALIGSIVAVLSGWLIEHYDTTIHPWKIFAFLWAAPILLFIPVYVSYYKGDRYITEFLYHAFIGSFFTLCIILITLLLIHINVCLALAVNLGLSYIILYLYFKHKLYIKI